MSVFELQLLARRVLEVHFALSTAHPRSDILGWPFRLYLFDKATVKRRRNAH